MKNNIVCSSCGLTMEESKLLSMMKDIPKANFRREMNIMTVEQIDEIARKYSGMGGVEDYRAFARDICSFVLKTSC